MKETGTFGLDSSIHKLPKGDKDALGECVRESAPSTEDKATHRDPGAPLQSAARLTPRGFIIPIAFCVWKFLKKGGGGTRSTTQPIAHCSSYPHISDLPRCRNSPLISSSLFKETHPLDDAADGIDSKETGHGWKRRVICRGGRKEPKAKAKKRAAVGSYT